jgi:hypothetical protein
LGFSDVEYKKSAFEVLLANTDIMKLNDIYFFLISGNVELIPMPPQEYHVSKVDIRKFDDKLVVDKNGLPVGKAPSTKTSFICKEKEPVLYEKIQKLALKVHRCLQFKDFSMIDIRVNSEGNPFVLEVNLFCSFGAQSVLSVHAEKFGWTNEKLFQTMVNNNFRRLLQ